MSNKQLSITKSRQMQPVIDEAMRTFPDATTPSQALTRALFHWYHGRESNGKRASLDRIERKIDRLIELLETINGDTDHA